MSQSFGVLRRVSSVDAIEAYGLDFAGSRFAGGEFSRAAAGTFRAVVGAVIIINKYLSPRRQPFRAKTGGAFREILPSPRGGKSKRAVPSLLVPINNS